jgi:hypothetical protein
MYWQGKLRVRSRYHLVRHIRLAWAELAWKVRLLRYGSNSR